MSTKASIIYVAYANLEIHLYQDSLDQKVYLEITGPGYCDVKFQVPEEAVRYTPPPPQQPGEIRV